MCVISIVERFSPQEINLSRCHHIWGFWSYVLVHDRSVCVCVYVCVCVCVCLCVCVCVCVCECVCDVAHRLDLGVRQSLKTFADLKKKAKL
jgi:hypothetical protein